MLWKYDDLLKINFQEAPKNALYRSNRIQNNTITLIHSCFSNIHIQYTNLKWLAERGIWQQKNANVNETDPDDIANWQLVTSSTKRINSPETSPNPKILNNQNIFSTGNRYSFLSIKDIIHNSNNIDTEMENDIIIKAPPPIFIKSIIKELPTFLRSN